MIVSVKARTQKRSTNVVVVGVEELVAVGQSLVSRAAVGNIISARDSVSDLKYSVSHMAELSFMVQTSWRVVPPRMLREATLVPLQRLPLATSL